MPSIHDYLTGKYLKARDLAGGQPTYQLAGFSVETVVNDEDEEDRVVVRFHEIEKGMVIGAKANALVLLKHFGDDEIETWDKAVKESPTYVRLSTAQTNFGLGLRLQIVDPEQTHIAQLQRQKEQGEPNEES